MPLSVTFIRVLPVCYLFSPFEYLDGVDHLLPQSLELWIIIICSQRFQAAISLIRQVVFDLLSEKGMCHVHCNVSLLVSESAGKNCGKETDFRSLSIENFNLSRENHFSALVCHVFFWVAIFRTDFLSYSSCGTWWHTRRNQISSFLKTD